jgi:hypothetical protein
MPIFHLTLRAGINADHIADFRKMVNDHMTALGAGFFRRLVLVPNRMRANFNSKKRVVAIISSW